MLFALMLGLGLLGETDVACAVGVKPMAAAASPSGSRASPGRRRLLAPPPFSKAPASAPSPEARPSAPPVHCTMRTVRADPQVDPQMAQTWEPEVDARMVVKSRCSN